MASAGRRSELQALMFDLHYIKSKPKGAGVTLYFSLVFIRVHGKPDFIAPNCPVTVLRYYYRYMTEYPELGKGRHRLIIPFKDNNAGKEPSAACMSCWSAAY